MSKADEMFEKLGYTKVIDNETEIRYEYKETIMGDFIVLKISREEVLLISLRSWNKFSMTPKEFKERYNWRWAK